MSEPNFVLAEPLTLGQETISRGAWCRGKVLLGLSLLIGSVFAVLFSPVLLAFSRVEEPGITMFGTPGANGMRGSYMQPFPAASPMSASCPRPGGLAMSVPAMQDALKKYGIPTSPLAKLALTQLAATRDPSMKAQVNQVFSSLDPVTQAKLQKLGRDVVARAQTLKPEDMAGATAPLGFWDPAGYSENFGEGKIAGLRSAELKHGRVCMLASLGIMVSEVFHPIFDGQGDGIPFASAIQSHFTPTMMQNFWPAFITSIGIIDTALEYNQDPDAMPGDYGFDPLGLKPKDPKAWLEVQNKELNNGRLAMFAAAGMIGQELATGKKIF